MNIKKITGAFCMSVCLMFSMFLPVHAADDVTLSFEKTENANELKVVLSGMPKTKSVSLNLKVDGNVSFENMMNPSKESEKAEASVDTRQSSKDTLDIYITSKKEIDTDGKIVLGTIQLRGDVSEKYTISLNKAKTGIKGVSTTYVATQIAADAPNLVMEGTSQEIVDTNKPVEPEKPGEDDNKPGEDTEKPGEDNEKPGEDGEKPGGSDTTQPGDSTITDGDSSASGDTQIDKTMKLSVTEVKDRKYLAMVKESLANISTKYKAFNIQITKDGKAISLKESVAVRVSIPEGFDKTKLKVYDIQDNNRSELAFTVNGNVVEFSITHLGNYVIAEQNVNGKDGSVGTGDSTSMTLYYALAGAALISIAILVVLREKRKRSI